MFALDRDGKNITKAQSGSPKVRNSSQPAYFGKEITVNLGHQIIDAHST